MHDLEKGRAGCQTKLKGCTVVKKDDNYWSMAFCLWRLFCHQTLVIGQF